MTATTKEPPWVDITEVCAAYGMTAQGVRVAIRKGTFPVATYKVGRRTVIDREVHEEFFRRRREEGLIALKLNHMLIGQ